MEFARILFNGQRNILATRESQRWWAIAGTLNRPTSDRRVLTEVRMEYPAALLSHGSPENIRHMLIGTVLFLAVLTSDEIVMAGTLHQGAYSDKLVGTYPELAGTPRSLSAMNDKIHVSLNVQVVAAGESPSFDNTRFELGLPPWIQ